jgi:hypothetical protein
MLLAQASSSSSSVSQTLQDAAAQAAVDTGAQAAADAAQSAGGTAQNFAQTAAANLPDYLVWIKHVDMLVALGLCVAFIFAFFTFAKNTVATMVFGIALAFIIAYFTPVLSWIPQIGEIPKYMVNVGAFGILSLLLTRTLYTNSFFEPMNVPTGKEVIIFAIIITGFFISLGLLWWPVEEIATFSQAFQTIFVNNPARSIWFASPLILAIALRGKF